MLSKDKARGASWAITFCTGLKTLQPGQMKVLIERKKHHF